MSPAAKPAVCIIVENLPVPADRRVWQEAQALQQAGYRVSVIGPKSRGFERARETRAGIEIYRHPIWEASGSLGYLAEYAWALAAEFALALRIFARTRFRILQACNPPDTIFLIARFFKLFGVRSIFDHHDLNPELYEAKFGRRDWGYRLVSLAERCTYRTADVAIATNESYREVALERGRMPPDRVFVVRSSPDLSKVHKTEPQPELRAGREHLVLYLGVMGPQDGVDLLLEAIAHLVKNSLRTDTFFVLIGSGPELPRLKALAAERGVNNDVLFTGFISADQPEAQAYLSTADFGVAPDPATPMNDKSTMNKTLEYMAYSLPVVMFDLKEGRRSAGDAALYARPNDTQEFAALMQKLLDSKPLRDELGARGRRRIEAELNWEMEKRSLLQAYDAALDISGNGRKNPAP
jgi:glycosyltransferase involved in cell wall biosynthesis